MSDDSAPGLFGDAPTADKSGYLVLARKYRPKTFEDLIGQEAMVRTIANSFALNRIPHAYILTGVRGIGKTTTARLLARALNYETDTIKGPSVTLEPLGVHCREIMESRHPDVLEMDAASRTGINDIRELLDGVRYAPVSARTKVYIIDEVHMLSTQAFNGLLKTLEEPPPHVKFIFATTEIRKVPVTVLSRCQRFDLKRITPERMVEHLSAICARENVAVDHDGLMLVTRAAEGSVRDALSLLDQAIVQKTGDKVTASDIRDMIGLADRGRMLDIFDAIARADAKAALLEIRAQYDQGADPAVMLHDLLDIAHECARIQALGADARILGGADWVERMRASAKQFSPAQLSRLWQMILKGHEETLRAPEPLAAAEMALVRVCAAASIPPPEEIARMLKGGAPMAPAAPSHAPGASEVSAPKLQTFDDVLALLNNNPDVNLLIDVERYVRPVAFEQGRILYEPIAGAPVDLAMKLQKVLADWTGEIWRVEAQASGGDQTFFERRAQALAEEVAAVKSHPFVADALKYFPGAEIRTIKNADGGETNVAQFPLTPPGPAAAKKRNGQDTKG